MHSKQSKGLSDHKWGKFFPSPKKRGKFGNFTVTIDTEDAMKSAQNEVSPVLWPWRLPSSKVLFSVYNTPVLCPPPPPALPLPLAHSDPSPHLTLSFHTSHSEFLFSSALKCDFTDCYLCGTDFLPTTSGMAVTGDNLCNSMAWSSAGDRRHAVPMGSCQQSSTTWDLKGIPNRERSF